MKNIIWFMVFLLLLLFTLVDKYFYHPQLDLIVKVNEIECVLDSLENKVRINEINIQWDSERILLIESEGYEEGLWSYGFSKSMWKTDQKYIK